MRKKNYFTLLLMLSAILTPGIESFSEKNIESFDFHARKKRVINSSWNENRPVSIQQAPYVVSIHEDGYYVCTGSILSTTAIITAAHCIENPKPYIILSGSSNVDSGVRHTISKKIIHPQYHPNEFENDLALAIITPPIDINHSPSRKITIYTGPIKENDLCTLSGWGHAHVTTPHKLELPQQLRSVSVPILNEGHCRDIYHGHVQISDRDICTLDPLRQKCCGEGDSGGPLVFQDQLVGIFAWSSGMGLFPDAPDVFVKLSHPAYKYWIVSNIQFMPNKTYNIHHKYDPLNYRNQHNPLHPHNYRNQYNPLHPHNLHNPQNIHYPQNMHNPHILHNPHLPD